MVPLDDFVAAHRDDSLMELAVLRDDIFFEVANIEYKINAPNSVLCTPEGMPDPGEIAVMLRR